MSHLNPRCLIRLKYDPGSESGFCRPRFIPRTTFIASLSLSLQPLLYPVGPLSSLYISFFRSIRPRAISVRPSPTRQLSRPRVYNTAQSLTTLWPSYHPTDATAVYTAPYTFVDSRDFGDEEKCTKLCVPDLSIPKVNCKLSFRPYNERIKKKKNVI